MKLLNAAFLAFLLAFAVAGFATDNKTYKGKWSERNRTSLKITNPDLKQGRHCYRHRCDILGFEGSPKNTAFQDSAVVIALDSKASAPIVRGSCDGHGRGSLTTDGKSQRGTFQHDRASPARFSIECERSGEPAEYLVDFQLSAPARLEACHAWEIQPYICRSVPLFRPEAPYVLAKYLHDLLCVPAQETPTAPREKIS